MSDQQRPPVIQGATWLRYNDLDGTAAGASHGIRAVRPNVRSRPDLRAEHADLGCRYR